jgi:transposase
MQVNKTELAHIMRTGWYREVRVKSMDSHAVRAMLGTRYNAFGYRRPIV